MESPCPLASFCAALLPWLAEIRQDHGHAGIRLGLLPRPTAGCYFGSIRTAALPPRVARELQSAAGRRCLSCLPHQPRQPASCLVAKATDSPAPTTASSDLHPRGPGRLCPLLRPPPRGTAAAPPFHGGRCLLPSAARCGLRLCGHALHEATPAWGSSAFVPTCS